MRIIKPNELERLHREYPNGTRIELVRMDDPQAPPAGTHGTVYGIDDAGSILVRWDTGNMLSIVPDAGDIVRKAGDTE